MWSFDLLTNAVVDEFTNDGVTNTLGLFTSTGYCLVGISFIRDSMISDGAIYFVVANIGVGLWNDPDADTNNTLQWRFWTALATPAKFLTRLIKKG